MHHARRVEIIEAVISEESILHILKFQFKGGHKENVKYLLDKQRLPCRTTAAMFATALSCSIDVYVGSSHRVA